MGGWLRKRYPNDIARVLVLRLAGIRVTVDANMQPSRNVEFSRSGLVAFIMVFASTGLVCSLVAVGADPVQEALVRFLPWALYFLGVGASTALLCHQLTQGFLHLTVPLDQALTSQGRSVYEAWAERSLNTKRQAVAGSALALIAPISLSAAQRVVGKDGRVLIMPISYFVVALAGFLIGATAYWVVAGLSLCRLLSRPGNMKLFPLAPARTPAIEDFSQLMVTGFALCACYSVVLLFPFIYWTYDVDLSSASPDSQSLFNVVRLFLIALCGIATLAFGAVPQYYFSQAIRATRRTSMLSLLKRLESDSDLWYGRQLTVLHSNFQTVSESPASTLGSGNIVQIAVGIGAAVLPFMVSILGFR